MKTILLLFLWFVAFTAIISGIQLTLFPDGSLIHLPVYILKNTPFRNFQIPGLILTCVVGAISLAAASYMMAGRKNWQNWSIAAGVVLTMWITAQLILLQELFWLQFIYLGIGILIVLLAYQLKGKWAV